MNMIKPDDPRLTAEPAAQTILINGSIVGAWCSVCHANTPHKYQPYALRKLVCVRCEEEATK